MINSFLKYKTKKLNSCSPSINDIKISKKILFSLFTRYGDTIIDLVVINEFIAQYPKKEYLVLCPRQMKPYVNELLPNIKCITLNKRNLFDMLKINKFLKKESFDIGFNPWSNGLDSCYFLTYCKKFLCYKNFNRPNVINHYQVVRKYLNLPEIDWKISKLVLKKKYKNILICPQSTDLNREVSINQIDELILKLKKKYQPSGITIASMNEVQFREGCDHFLFKKTEKSSQQFINLVKKNDLIIASDSGPLHIVLALNKDVLAIFNTTSPDIVVKSDACLGYIDAL